MRFLDLELEDPVPDATTIWLFRQALAEAGLRLCRLATADTGSRSASRIIATICSSVKRFAHCSLRIGSQSLT
jgi:hypothetical protein